MVLACSMIGGTVDIEENCRVASSSCIRNAKTIGKNVTVGLSTMVTKSIPDSKVVVGSLAMPIEDIVILRHQQMESVLLHKKSSENKNR